MSVEKETAQRRAKRMMGELDASNKATYTKGEVKSLLSVISQTSDVIMPKPSEELGCRSPVTVTDLRRGDVFIAKYIGGKVRPWIVLSVEKDLVSALAMSSGEKAPGMTPSKCRLWPDSWIGCTMSLFTKDLASAEVTRPYTNSSHLVELEDAALSHYRRAPNIVSIADIRGRFLSRAPKSSELDIHLQTPVAK